MRTDLCVIGNALILAGWASPYVQVSHVHPHLVGGPGASLLAAVEQTLTKAMHEEHAKPLVALAHCLTALQAASREVERDPTNTTAVRDYNFGVARIFQIVHDAKLDPWNAPLTIHSPAGDFTLAHKPDPRSEWHPALYEFTPADEFDVGGKYVTERTTRFGIGAPIVAVEREPKNRRADFAPSRIYYSVTVVAHFKGRRCVLSFEDPLGDRGGGLQWAHGSARSRLHCAAGSDAPGERSEKVRVLPSFEPGEVCTHCRHRAAPAL